MHTSFCYFLIYFFLSQLILAIQITLFACTNYMDMYYELLTLAMKEDMNLFLAV